jgi:hypothetical protein
MEALSPSEKLIHGSRAAHFEQDVDVLGILEEMFEADDVGMVQTTVDLDLRHELLLCTRLGQSGLIDDFGGRYTIVFHVGKLVTSGETTFT